MSVLTGQIFLRGVGLGPAIESVGRRLAAWSATEECLEDYEEKESTYFSTAGSNQKARLTLLLPMPGGLIALLDSSSFWQDASLAGELSAELQCDSLWFALDGSRMELRSSQFSSGETIREVKLPQSAPDAPLQHADVEAIAFDALLEFGVLPAYAFLRLNHLEPLGPREMPDPETPFLLQLVKGEDEFDLYASAYAVRLPAPPASGMLAFPDDGAAEQSEAIDYLNIQAPPADQLEALYAALARRAERYRQCGWRRTVFRLAHGQGGDQLFRALSELSGGASGAAIEFRW